MTDEGSPSVEGPSAKGDANGFIGYPSDPPGIGECIEAGVRLTKRHATRYGTWRSLEIGGQFIPKIVHDGVASSSIFVADITYLNLNVAYEVGLAIGQQIPLALVRNLSFNGNHGLAPGLGIYETIGQDRYTNGQSLADLLGNLTGRNPINTSFPLNHGMPVYTIQPKAKDDFALRTVSRLKRAALSYRVFDAGEQTTLNASETIQQVAESYGVLLILLHTAHPESFIHNLRTMFAAGIAVGLRKPLAILSNGIDQPPMDVAEKVVECKFPQQVDEEIQVLATDVTVALQRSIRQRVKRTQLESLDLGASSAENELATLDAYYVATAAYQKCLRGEARLVVGRKGSGKSALFFQLGRALNQYGYNLVVDLKPDGFQLITLKESLSPVLSTGSLEHLITAFWEYVLVAEVARQYIKDMAVMVRRDPDLVRAFSDLEATYEKQGLSVEGDFSERIVASLKRIEQQIGELAPNSSEVKLTLSSPQVTNLVHRGLLSELQNALYPCLRAKREIWILFDNIDKGWPAHGLTPTDIMVVRTLQEAMRKIARSLDQRRIASHGMVFLRNDVYELLVSETPDRGKEARVLLDWSDRDALEELVRRRLIYGGLTEAPRLEEMWSQICTPYVAGKQSFNHLLDHCLMRPRFLLDLIGHCKSSAVNVGHNRIEIDDIEKGIRLFSTELVMDISFEIADVMGNSYADAGKLLMKLVGCDQILSEAELMNLLLEDTNGSLDKAQLMKVLLWHGVIGLSSEEGDNARYIYDFNYNLPIMEAGIAKDAGPDREPLFKINDAFSSGLWLEDSDAKHRRLI